MIPSATGKRAPTDGTKPATKVAQPALHGVHHVELLTSNQKRRPTVGPPEAGAEGWAKWSAELEERDLGFRRIERPGLEVIGFGPHSISRDSAAPTAPPSPAFKPSDGLTFNSTPPV